MRERTNAYAAFGEQLARLREDDTFRPVEVASRLHLPTSTVHEWVQQLRFQRAIVEASGGYHVDRPRLVATMTAHRIARIAPVAELSTSMDIEALARRLRQESIPHRFAMLTAANAWAFFEPRRSVQVYISRSSASALRSVLEPGSTTVECFAENIAELPHATRGGIEVTSAFLTYLDCRAHPEGGAHASFLERNVLRWETSS